MLPLVDKTWMRTLLVKCFSQNPSFLRTHFFSFFARAAFILREWGPFLFVSALDFLFLLKFYFFNLRSEFFFLFNFFSCSFIFLYVFVNFSEPCNVVFFCFCFSFLVVPPTHTYSKKQLVWYGSLVIYI